MLGPSYALLQNHITHIFIHNTILELPTVQRPPEEQSTHGQRVQEGSCVHNRTHAALLKAGHIMRPVRGRNACSTIVGLVTVSRPHHTRENGLQHAALIGGLLCRDVGIGRGLSRLKHLSEVFLRAEELHHYLPSSSISFRPWMALGI